MRIIRTILGLYWDNGKENESYYSIWFLGVIWGYMGIYSTPTMENEMEKKMEHDMEIEGF